MNKCIFLDRDGVINKDYVDYVFTVEKFQLLDGVPEALKKLKDAGYLLILITNQSGIIKGIYSEEDVKITHEHMQKVTGNVIDYIYFSPYHQKWTNSLSRKPNTLMFEKAIARFDVDVSESWMIGDKRRDLIPAKHLHLKTIIVDNDEEVPEADYNCENLLQASQIIVD